MANVCLRRGFAAVFASDSVTVTLLLLPVNMVSVEVRTKDDKKLALARELPGTVEVSAKDSSTATVLDLKREIARRFPKVRRAKVGQGML